MPNTKDRFVRLSEEDQRMIDQLGVEAVQIKLYSFEDEVEFPVYQYTLSDGRRVREKLVMDGWLHFVLVDIS